MQRRRRSVASLPALALVALAGCKAEGTPGPGAAEAPRPVQVAEIRLAPAAAAPRAFTGVVKARREADIGFRAGGRILSRSVEVGGRVRAGDELARLDP